VREIRRLLAEVYSHYASPILHAVLPSTQALLELEGRGSEKAEQEKKATMPERHGIISRGRLELGRVQVELLQEELTMFRGKYAMPLQARCTRRVRGANKVVPFFFFLASVVVMPPSPFPEVTQQAEKEPGRQADVAGWRGGVAARWYSIGRSSGSRGHRIQVPVRIEPGCSERQARAPPSCRNGVASSQLCRNSRHRASHAE